MLAWCAYSVSLSLERILMKMLSYVNKILGLQGAGRSVDFTLLQLAFKEGGEVTVRHKDGLLHSGAEKAALTILSPNGDRADIFAQTGRVKSVVCHNVAGGSSTSKCSGDRTIPAPHEPLIELNDREIFAHWLDVKTRRALNSGNTPESPRVFLKQLWETIKSPLPNEAPPLERTMLAYGVGITPLALPFILPVVTANFTCHAIKKKVLSTVYALNQSFNKEAIEDFDKKMDSYKQGIFEYPQICRAAILENAHAMNKLEKGTKHSLAHTP